MNEVAFWIMSVILVCSAIAVVTLKDVFRAALLLILCFFTVAGIYITLNADFLAAVQVLVYVGAIGILLMFAIMLTRNLKEGNPVNKLHIPALLVSLMMMATIVGVVVATDWDEVKTNIESNTEIHEVVKVDLDDPTTEGIAKSLFEKDGGFILPFEMASVLLLAALIGAVVLVKQKEND